MSKSDVIFAKGSEWNNLDGGRKKQEAKRSTNKIKNKYYISITGV